MSAFAHTQVSLLDLGFFFSQPYTYYIVIALIGVLASLLVYLVLYGWSRGLVGVKESIEEIEEASSGASRRSVEGELGARWAVRIVGLVLWAAYSVFFVNALLPFCLLTTRQGVTVFNSAEGWMLELLGFIVLWLGVHQHVVFARLVHLRPRLFGGELVIESTLQG
ncbi:hypothetical protein [Candidatus Protofrankia californiensis]|uniref:hypothetical protein n=1 Tax=Candidatus Protofrankia californiensis TaxID=1839754 RepID=UPI0010410676|nr:hypothetical protein [Candidatus Protofrankia californiensis]